MGEEILPAHERERLYIRLGKNRRDRKLAQHITEDRRRGVNVSKLMKELLYSYYTGEPMPGYSGPIENQAVDEDVRQNALSARLKKLSFDSLKEG
jgi:hypothetical protein